LRAFRGFFLLIDVHDTYLVAFIILYHYIEYEKLEIDDVSRALRRNARQIGSVRANNGISK